MKLIKEFIKGFKQGYKEAMYKRNKPVAGTIVGLVSYANKDIPIVYCPSRLENSNGIFAALVAYADADEYRIEIDDLYMSAPDTVKEFINQHELGHLFLIENGQPNKFTLQDEVNADRYAMEHTSQNVAIEALNYIWVAGARTGNVDKIFTIPSRLKEAGADVSTMYIVGGNGIRFYEPDLRKLLEKQERGDFND